MRKKRIFKRSLAMALVEKGHRLLRIDDNKNVLGFMVYVFEDNFQFQEDLYLLNKKLSKQNYIY
ncbi:hypothetical protein P2R64_00200 [Priestia megaterium]|uniref:hypothetical protein n=1 Tax=Priestia megaterium TaxID=1404 RepID=UPI0021C1E7AF|nr:hypothetical protein [Priestia megaterium]MCT9858234.1 hypothetical protein [Priestia megaterium]MDF1958481.1 hypothetical protein [Priestia megaterium]